MPSNGKLTLPPHSVAVVLGTRPEIVKLAHLIHLLGPAAKVIHTGQHYDAGLSESFINAFGLADPAVYLGVGGKSRGGQIGTAVSALDEYFEDHIPRAVVVQGDTNAALAGGIAANARDIPLVHVEAGLRSHDRRMPEEHNRVLIDHLGDLLCAPTQTARENLLEEGIADERIRVTGNTVVEAVLQLLPEKAAREVILDKYRLAPESYILSTFHRPENVDDPERFRIIVEQLASLELPVVLPLHPRSLARAREHEMTEALESIRVVEPIGYQEFLALGAESAFLISDSGGIQEEASVYKRPVIVVRRSTERPEVLGSFAELVEPGAKISEIAERWTSEGDSVRQKLAEMPSPYGDGSASALIAKEIGVLLEGT
jgi:UDP-N-acetylglucosamine 2-epimerase (non-hydrolysing)